MNSHHNSPLTIRRWMPACLCWWTLTLAWMTTAIAGVEYVGLEERLETNVRAFSALETTSCDSARWRVERLFRDADQDIRRALQAFGYYDPEIAKSLTWGDECWLANFEIDVGDPVRLRDVDIRVDGPAATDPAFLARLTATRPAEADVLEHGVYSNFKAALSRAAAHAGFFDADFGENTVAVDREALAADMRLRFESGPKYRFGTVTFTEGILDRNLLEGYADIRPGDPYSAKAINDLYEALTGSSYFNTVLIRTEPLDTDAKTAPVNVVLTPAKRRIYSVGVGYTTDTGPHGRLGYTNRRVNTRGHQLESKLYLSPVRSELNAAYRWPRKDPRREWYSVTTGYQQEDTDTSEHETYKLGLLRSRSLGKTWLETRYIDYAYEDFRVADQQSTSQLVILGTNWEAAAGRALSRATKGYRLSVDVRGASDSLGSDTSFLQLRTKAKWIRSFGDRTRVLLRSGIGTTAKDEFTELPASVRFFAGGDRSVRGYEFESLGPVDEEGDIIGGSHIIDASVELDYLFLEKWSFAAFVDTGAAFNDTDMDFSTGSGIGLRWYSPVGPIRLDFAHPFDDPDNSLRVHISLGPDL